MSKAILGFAVREKETLKRKEEDVKEGKNKERAA